MQATQEDPSLKKEKTKGYSIAGSLSLFIHLGIFLLIGGTVIIEQVIPKQTMTGEVVVNEAVVESPPEDQPEDQPQDIPQPTSDPQPQAAAAEASPFDMNTVVMDSPSPTFSVPNVSVSSVSPSVPGTSTGTGTTGTSGTGSPRKAINLFGAKTESAKLGVILDCSGSAHPFLLAALKEIDKNFDNAPTVLAVGCGMKENPPPAKVELYGRIHPDKEKDKSGSRTILGQLAMAEGKNKDLERFLDRLKRRDDVWAINGGDIYATQMGFDELIKEGVDTIYWFSDLQDAVDPKVMERLVRELKRKDIKVIVHNFSGQKVPALQESMAKDTGGQAISKKP